ncbi:polysaccharide deacetylase family protein [Streptomyces sp. UNOC14_S4]|nr:polysaccharide deacetylase family protein [Streptomyces sp. UNOC14_S4]
MPAAEAAKTPIPAHAGNGGIHPVALSPKTAQDLAGWAKARLALEKQRKAHTLVVHPAVPEPPAGQADKAGQAGQAKNAAATAASAKQANAARVAQATQAASVNAARTASVSSAPARTTSAQTVSARAVSVKAAQTVSPPKVLKPLATPSGTTALVLYDTTGPYGQLGELYAMAVANLSGHFGTVTTKPVSAYTAGMTEQYTATFYIGSTYYGGSVPDAVPAAFYQDALTTAHPVTWMGDNIWNMANAVGVTQFEQHYGWDPTNSYFAPNGSVGNINQVTYKGQQLTRTIPAGQDGGVLHPALVSGTGFPQVNQLAQAKDGTTGATTPWAIRSGNLTYVGEIPFAYVSESDRVVAFEDLMFDALAPQTAERHRAFVRLEDISPTSDPAQLRSMADYLASQNIPYGINVIPVYTDPNGVYNNGKPQTVTLAQAPDVVNALKYMLAHGAVLMNHGLTHQYSNVNNPYTGVTGDDFEFFKAHVDAANNVVLDGPPPEDNAVWAQSRVTSALAAFAAVGLPKPTLWTTPHYAASAADYRVLGQNYTARLERSLYFAGTLSGGTVDSSRYIGQFFPYSVKDVYGTSVLPENIGNYEPLPYNNHPARLPADLIASAKANLAVRDGVASFFYHPYYPVAPLQQTIDGIRALGYTFVGPTDLAQ